MDRLKMITAMEGKLIPLSVMNDVYCLVKAGKFFNPVAGRYVTLTQCSIDTIERYYYTAVEIVEPELLKV